MTTSPALLDGLSRLRMPVSVQTLDDLATVTMASTTATIAVVDIRSTGGVPDTLAGWRRRHAGVPLVLVVRTLEPTVMLEAMRAGASECLPEPLDVAALALALGRLAKETAPDADGRVTICLGAKGGVGTTTVAVNLAASLAMTGARTLLIDLHASYGDAAIYLGADPRFSIVDVLENAHRLDAVLARTLTTTTAAGVDLFASSRQALVAPADADRVRHLLEFGGREYRHVVVDCPLPDAAMLDVLALAHKVVLVTAQDVATAARTTRLASLLTPRLGPDRCDLVLNRFDAAAELGQADIERATSLHVRALLPFESRTALEAMTDGRPVVTTGQGRLATRLNDLARDVAGLVEARKTVVARPGLFSRLSGRR